MASTPPSRRASPVPPGTAGQSTASSLPTRSWRRLMRRCATTAARHSTVPTVPLRVRSLRRAGPSRSGCRSRPRTWPLTTVSNARLPGIFAELIRRPTLVAVVLCTCRRVDPREPECWLPPPQHDVQRALPGVRAAAEPRRPGHAGNAQRDGGAGCWFHGVQHGRLFARFDRG